MKRTLLDLVQGILSSLDGDEVNSISDTTESLQVANIVKSVYYDIINPGAYPENFALFTLQASTDATKPCVMYLPDDISEVSWVKYDRETLDDQVPQFQEMKPMDLREFLKRQDYLRIDNGNVGTMTLLSARGDNITFYYTNDNPPSYYTTVDEKTVLFDSYEADIEDTLQASKTQCYGAFGPPFTFSDNFIPDLEDKKFPLLYNEAKSLSFFELKQQQHPMATQTARRQWIKSQAPEFDDLWLNYKSYPNYGRR